ncbi:iron-containing alcohol dehydrogenase [Azospirillum sp. TSO35-2]|uniref:iron-containing alcohol dehydrogenase n=1 Tax=Azospirillum sp. TSO35-2 TaxID=716796 RepID=UPI000D611257|nr:iron-containing alcohol dehydrogenase [Azospirillum sp. TSO35-2]PWC33583.1 alcohol dehydrogenase [Azospirillum sp. TSO35-2]
MSAFGIQRSPRTILFGAGQRAALPQLVRPYGERVMICTDNRFGADLLLSGIADGLRDAGLTVGIYDRTLAELPMSCIDEAAEAARDIRPDVIVAIGGGSCIDLGKLVAVRLAYDGPLSDLYGEFKVPAGVLPVIAVPTTSGTGSEVTPVAVLDNPATGGKVGISSPHLIPQAAVCDPELTLSCPPGLTANTGADAMTHAIEAFTTLRREPTPELGVGHVFVGNNVFSHMQAATAIRCLAGHLERAVGDGTDLVAREQVMMGALLAGQAFGTAGTAAAHAIQYPVGAFTHTPHGLGVALLLPYVMEHNRPACVEIFAEIAGLFGLPDAPAEQRSRQAIDAVERLFGRIGIPKTLADIGVRAEDLDIIAEQSLKAQRLVKNNPRPLDLDGIQRIIAAAFEGNRDLLRS